MCWTFKRNQAISFANFLQSVSPLFSLLCSTDTVGHFKILLVPERLVNSSAILLLPSFFRFFFLLFIIIFIIMNFCIYGQFVFDNAGKSLFVGKSFVSNSNRAKVLEYLTLENSLIRLLNSASKGHFRNLSRIFLSIPYWRVLIRTKQLSTDLSGFLFLMDI